MTSCKTIPECHEMGGNLWAKLMAFFFLSLTLYRAVKMQYINFKEDGSFFFSFQTISNATSELMSPLLLFNTHTHRKKKNGGREPFALHIDLSFPSEETQSTFKTANCWCTCKTNLPKFVSISLTVANKWKLIAVIANEQREKLFTLLKHFAKILKLS